MESAKVKRRGSWALPEGRPQIRWASDLKKKVEQVPMFAEESRKSSTCALRSLSNARGSENTVVRTGASLLTDPRVQVLIEHERFAFHSLDHEVMSFKKKRKYTCFYLGRILNNWGFWLVVIIFVASVASKGPDASPALRARTMRIHVRRSWLVPSSRNARHAQAAA